MRRFVPLLKPYRAWLALAPLSMVLEVAMDLMQPKLMSKIVDVGIQAGNQQAVYKYGMMMMTCAVIGLIGGCACTFFSSRAALSFGNDLRRKMFRHILSFSFSETDRFTAGSLITRLTNDVNFMQHMVVIMTRMLIRSPLLLIGSVVLVLMTNPLISVPLLLAAPVLAAIVVRKIMVMRSRFEQMQKRIDDVNSVMQENLTGMRIVKAFASEGDELDRFSGANTRLAEMGIETERIMITMGPYLSLVQHTTLVVIIFIAAAQINMRLIMIGEVMAIINYSTQVMMSLVMASLHAMHFSRASVSARRINEVLETTPSIADGPHGEPPDHGGVQFRNVSFRYPNASGDPVLQDVTLDIANGEHIAVMGATGSGKSSLVNLIPRFYEASGGEVSVGGRAIREYSLHALRDAIGVVMQETLLFSGTIADNIRWGRPNATDAEVERAARIAEAHGFISSFDKGYETPIAQGGVTLSGGQKQRIAIARAIIMEPRILILDDSTSAVDVITEARIQEALRREMIGMTVVKIAQRVSSTKDSDRIVLLEDGRITAVGKHAELMRTSAAYRDICDSQDMAGEVIYGG